MKFAATKKQVPENVNEWTDEDRNNVCFAAARLADNADDVAQQYSGRLKAIENNMKTFSEKVSSQLTAILVGPAGGPGGGRHTTDDDLRDFNAAAKANLNAEGLQAYSNAFTNYLRRGEAGLTGEMRNALSVGYDRSAGYLVTPDSTGQTIGLLRETSPMRQFCSVQTISSDALEGPIDNDEAASGWVAEQSARAETSAPKVGKYRIEVYEQYANPRATQQLLDDASIDITAWLGEKIADKLGRTENTAFVRGNGSNKPRGFMDYPNAVTADATRPWGTIQYVKSGNASGFVTPTTSVSQADCLVDLVYALKASYRAGAAFAMNSTTAGTVRKWKDAEGRFIWQDSLQEGEPSRLLGYPVAFFEDMDDIDAGKFPIAFANWKRAYTVVDHRVGMRVLVDPYTVKGSVNFYTTKRTGGGITGSDAIKILKIAA